MTTLTNEASRTSVLKRKKAKGKTKVATNIANSIDSGGPKPASLKGVDHRGLIAVVSPARRKVSKISNRVPDASD